MAVALGLAGGDAGIRGSSSAAVLRAWARSFGRAASSAFATAWLRSPSPSSTGMCRWCPTCGRPSGKGAKSSAPGVLRDQRSSRAVDGVGVAGGDVAPEGRVAALGDVVQPDEVAEVVDLPRHRGVVALGVLRRRLAEERGQQHQLDDGAVDRGRLERLEEGRGEPERDAVADPGPGQPAGADADVVARLDRVAERASRSRPAPAPG